MRSWLAIPALGAVGCGAALALGEGAGMIAATGATAAAITAAVRVLGPVRRRDDDPDATPASLVGAVTGALAALAYVAGTTFGPLPWLAAAAAAWTLAELARPLPPEASPSVAVLPATIAAVIDPAYAALVLVAGIRLWRSPQRRAGWLVAVPIAGAIAIAVALLASRASGGVLASLWHAWSTTADAPGSIAGQLGAAIGPIGAVAAVAGLVHASRTRPIGLAVVAVGSAVACHRAGAITPSVLLVAALAIGIAVGRLAAVVRLPTAQLCIGATCGLLLVVEPALLAYDASRRQVGAFAPERHQGDDRVEPGQERAEPHHQRRHDDEPARRRVIGERHQSGADHEQADAGGDAERDAKHATA